MAGKAGRRIYWTKRWKRLRWVVFARDNYRCVACGKAGRLECDHVEPIRNGGDWYRLDNLQTLCRGCHIQKTKKELAEAQRNTLPKRKPPSPARAALMALAGMDSNL